MSQHVYLFRYRDLLTNDTLGKHRELIDEKGHCWWGWWQRPGEDSRLDLWSALEQRLAQRPVQIGLFNSDPEKKVDQVHWATLTKIVCPQDGGSAPNIPNDEADLVPEYYRETPFSSAWMCLTEIKEEAATKQTLRKAAGLDFRPQRYKLLQCTRSPHQRDFLGGLLGSVKGRQTRSLLSNEDLFRSIYEPSWPAHARRMEHAAPLHDGSARHTLIGSTNGSEYVVRNETCPALLIRPM